MTSTHTSSASPTALTTNGVTKTSSVASQVTNPAFFGYESLSLVGSSVAFSSKDCQPASTFFTSDSYVACCSGSCTPFTGCLAGSTLIGPSRTSICAPSLTCKTDVVYATESAVGGQAIYCGQGPNHVWYRALPSNGIDVSVPTSVSTPPSGSGTSLGGPVGGALGGVFFLAVIGVLLCLCGGCGGKSSSSRSRDNGYTPEDIEYERQRQEQIRIGYMMDSQEQNRLNNNGNN